MQDSKWHFMLKNIIFKNLLFIKALLFKVILPHFPQPYSFIHMVKCWKGKKENICSLKEYAVL